MKFIFQIVACLSCGIFTGAAIYINLVEHPARMACGVKGALAQWHPSYHRATRMQASLSIISFLSGMTAAVLDHNLLWAVASLLIGSVVPFTFMFIMKTNKALQTIPADGNDANAEELLGRWAVLHGVRSVLGGIAFVLQMVILAVL
nr:DUF1772 domain-containing protein [uncultured Desulfobacter sp.]